MNQLLLFQLKIVAGVACFYFGLCIFFQSLEYIAGNRLAKIKVTDAEHLKYRNLLIELVHSLVHFCAFAIGSLCLGVLYLHKYTKIYQNPYQYGKVYLWLSPLLFLFLYDFYFYWMHRLLHRKTWIFKLIHKTHHKSLRVHSLSSESNSILEALLQYAGAIIILITIPMYSPLSIYMFYVLIFIAVYVHSNYEFVPQYFKNIYILRYFYGSVKAHTIHHIQFNGNYGLITTFWDSLFGTIVKKKV